MNSLAMERSAFSKGMVEFIELPRELREELFSCIDDPIEQDKLIARWQISRREKGNLVFNFPREQYAKLDRGETPEPINARYITLANGLYADPAVLTVTNEILRIPTSTKAVDPANNRNSIIRFILEAGQFIGAWQTAVLIGGADATSTPGTGKIIAAVNNIVDDTNGGINRDGTTIHLVNWKLKHLDSSEV